MKRAAIYIRTSSEQQAERVSPEAQEKDCRDYCAAHDYQVFDLYKDTEKYRVGSRMVEPSGTRADRPQLKRILADADAGLFDVLIAWREDRLYRGVNRAMLELSERVKSKVFSIELVKEFYDPSVAVVKAWAAGIELEAKHDRFMMGVGGRLAQGKPWCATPPYGYRSDNDQFTIDAYEAEWVKNIWKWYGSGTSLSDIRQTLINADVPQRRAKINKYHWERSIIRKILNNDFYYTGIFMVKWDGINYEIPIPPLVDDLTFRAVRDRLAKFHAWPAANLKTKSLAAGKVYCEACGARMILLQTTVNGKKYLYYKCRLYTARFNQPDCSHSVMMEKFDRELWAKVWDFISVPGRFENAIAMKIDEIRAEERDADSECEALERQLQENGFERDKVITWARQGRITDSDLDVQLAALNIQGAELRKELTRWKLMTGGRVERLEELFQAFQEKTQRGLSILEDEPESPERADKIFEARKKIIDEIVVRVDVAKDKSTKVYTEFDLPGFYGSVDNHRI
jgi:DNA invertase Pin-like site-specific DNA recombinase